MKIRPLRGQVVVREIRDEHPTLWTPDPTQRQQRTHRGLVLALGPPSRLTEHPASPEVPYGFEVGAIVQYHFGAVGTQESRTRTWSDGKPATWICQVEVDAVWEPDEGDAFDFDGTFYPTEWAKQIRADFFAEEVADACAGNTE